MTMPVTMMRVIGEEDGGDEDVRVTVLIVMMVVMVVIVVGDRCGIDVMVVVIGDGWW